MGGMAKSRMMDMAETGFKEKSFFEYHLYTLGRKTTINNSETKQVSLLGGTGVPVVKRYVVDGQDFYYHNTYHPGSPIKDGRMAKYTLPFVLGESEIAYGGYWMVEGERILAGRDARLRLNFFARKVHLVLGGTGYVDVLLDGKLQRRVHVTQPRLYTLLDQGKDRSGRLELRFTPGLSAYAFTFG